MDLRISSKDEGELASAIAFVKEFADGKVADEKSSGSSWYCSVYLRSEDHARLRGDLLEKFPTLDISTTEIDDVEDRDSSWWSTTKYQSTVDRDGRRCYRVTGSTGWA